MSALFDSAKSQFLLHNTLACLAESLVGTVTCIDLRNECSVSGRLEHVDGFMNVYMTDVLFRDHKGQELTFESLFIQSRNVMFVHIPRHVSVLNNIQTNLQSKQKQRTTTGRTLKQKRVNTMQQEVLQKIQAMKKQRIAQTKDE
uniref:U7 snRNA-associated Sm-like protein LSm10 n=1 Tax=Cacopsylla melanoneura TaxID=428564 RepID=A0A8D8TUI3_9HEMI